MKMDSNKIDKEQSSSSIWLVAFLILFAVGAWATWAYWVVTSEQFMGYIKPSLSSDASTMTLGDVMDAAGLLNGFFGAFALALAIWAVVMQRADQKASQSKWREESRMMMLSPVLDKAAPLRTSISGIRLSARNFERSQHIVAKNASDEAEAQTLSYDHNNFWMRAYDVSSQSSRFFPEILSRYMNTPGYQETEESSTYWEMSEGTLNEILSQYRCYREHLDKIYRVNHRMKAQKRLLARLKQYEYQLKAIESMYAEPLHNGATPASRVAEAYSHIYALEPRIAHISKRLEHIHQLPESKLRGHCSQDYFQLLKSLPKLLESMKFSLDVNDEQLSDGMEELNDMSESCFLVNLRECENYKPRSEKIKNYDQAMEELDTLTRKCFSICLTRHPEISQNMTLKLIEKISKKFENVEQVTAMRLYAIGVMRAQNNSRLGNENSIIADI